MMRRPLGQTGFEVSPIGFGAVKIGRNQKLKYPDPFDLPDRRQVHDLLHGLLDLGINHVLALPPFYYKNVSEEGLFRYVAELIERMDTQKLHIYLYHIPPVAQVGWPVDLVKRLAAEFPDTVVGLKDSSGDWSYTQALLEAMPPWQGNGSFQEGCLDVDDEVDEDLAGERYRVDDVDFTLKTNVIQTNEGLRMHLPSLDERSASAKTRRASSYTASRISGCSERR